MWSSLLWVLCWIPLIRPEDNKCYGFTDLNFGNVLVGTKLNVKLLLYTREKEDCGFLLDLEKSTINVTKKTIFIIHGYRPTGSYPVWLDKLAQLLLSKEDMNVIIVDWNEGAATLLYPLAASNTKKVAVKLKDFLDKNVGHGSLDSVYMIGVSLGAHIAGFVGQMFNGSIGRITGVDPAGPLFKNKPKDERLDSSDAQFVDVIHTDTNGLGSEEPMGHIDFYSNGGKNQPGCPDHVFAGKEYFVCDHRRAIFLFINSLKNPQCNISAYPCTSYKDFQHGNCYSCEDFFPKGCPVLGYHADEWKSSLKSKPYKNLYFHTTNKEPFCVQYYILDIITWNKRPRWGDIMIKLTNASGSITESKMNRVAKEFQKYKEVHLLAKFQHDFEKISRISLKFSTGNVFGPKYKLRIIRMRLRPLTKPERSHLCRYDLILEENTEVEFRPITCKDLEM
ncbi:lipase member H [Latimeria chalumnae]|uniref:lipase member H n=1 Tax=Latimeria chalumnae TaxID=7897 RepID=UPI00313E702F